MKKILIFSLAYYPKHVGGAEVAIKEITDRIDPRDIEFHLITNRYDSSLPKKSKEGNVHVHRIGFALPNIDFKRTHSPLFYLVKILYVPLAAILALRLHRKIRFDGMWAMMTYMLFPITLMKLVFVRVRYVLTLQEGDPFHHVFERWYILPFNLLLYWGFRNATAIQAISYFLAAWAKEMGYKREVEVIPNAVNTAHFTQTYSEEELQKVRNKIGKNEGEVWMVTTSRLVHKNGIDDVIRSLAHTPENVHFLIYGTGPDEDMFKKLAEELRVGSRVHWGGFLDHADMPKHLKACDIFIRPSRSEGMGNSFVEAMAAELPVIATQEGGIADFLFDEKRNSDKQTTGWAVDADSPEQIAVAVKDIIERPDKVQEVIGNAKQLALEKYDWDLIARNMRERVFHRLL